MTLIEQALFLDSSAHCITSFALSSDAMVLTLHPWERPNTVCHARFSNPQIIAKNDSYADGDHKLPWDTIGFDSEPLPGGRWRFCLHTDCIEYAFESPWPEIRRASI